MEIKRVLELCSKSRCYLFIEVKKIWKNMVKKYFY